jgi:predicted transcriptional regulator
MSETKYLIPNSPSESYPTLKPKSQFDRRSKVEVYCDVLYAVGSGAEKPTHIMYKSNLSYNVLAGYIEKLSNKGLIISEELNAKKRYHLSERGFEVLKQFLILRQELDLASDYDEDDEGID